MHRSNPSNAQASVVLAQLSSYQSVGRDVSHGTENKARRGCGLNLQSILGTFKVCMDAMERKQCLISFEIESLRDLLNAL